MDISSRTALQYKVKLCKHQGAEVRALGKNREAAMPTTVQAEQYSAPRKKEGFMSFRFVLSVTLVACLAGCANVQPVLAPTVAADPASGYVAGLFTKMKIQGYAFVVRPVGGSGEYVMPLGEDSALPKELSGQTVAIKLPPGTYTVAQWITYATLTKEISSRNAITGALRDRSFEIKPGTVTHLGSFDIWETKEATPRGLLTRMRIQPLPFSQAEVRKAFAATYPNLASQPLRCVLCTDTITVPPVAQ
ncbi:MAG TPA: hypothetical protein H9903_20795 [Candidatus Aquabacterium excrementipullorum]|nr:hypothetical protein [Candidatus Aquabacterium excrementipullorum]